jgi:hypothetical protein
MINLQGRNMLLRSRTLKFLVVSTVLIYLENNVFRCSTVMPSQLRESNSLSFVIKLIFDIFKIRPFHSLCSLLPLFAVFLFVSFASIFFCVQQTFGRLMVVAWTDLSLIW